MQMLWRLLVTWLGIGCVCYGQQELDICTNSTEVRTRLARIKNLEFPGHVTPHRICQCSVRSTELMDISIQYLLVMQETTQLEINCTTNNSSKLWPRDYQDNLIISENTHIIIAQNASFAEVSFTSAQGHNSWAIFQVNIKASPQAALTVHCSETADQTGTEESQQKSSGALALLDKVCSPYLIIILGSLCAAFLLILLAVSITLCCVVPKKRKKYLDVIRRSRIMNKEVQPSGCERKQTNSYLYDEAFFRKSQASNLEPSQLYSASTLPSSRTRASVPLYANAETINTNI